MIFLIDLFCCSAILIGTQLTVPVVVANVTGPAVKYHFDAVSGTDAPLLCSHLLRAVR